MAKGLSNVVRLDVRVVTQDLFLAHSVRDHSNHVCNGNAQATEDVAPISARGCSSTPFSTGLPSVISASSPTISVAANDLVLSADNLPDQPGQFIAAQGQAAIPFANGTLCLDPASLQRLLPITFPQGGFTSIAVDFASGAQTPSGAGPVNVLPGTTHYFQRWNRDPGVGAGSNLSNGVGVCIVP